MRRLDDFAMIDRQFKYRLRKESPCTWTDLENYFDWVTYRTEDDIVDLLKQQAMTDTIKPEEWLEFSRKIRSEIREYIHNNFYEYAEIYYRRNKESNCPE